MPRLGKTAQGIPIYYWLSSNYQVKILNLCALSEIHRVSINVFDINEILIEI